MQFGVLAVCCAAVLGGCAKSSGSVTAAYVSPYQYESWTCWQLADEAARVNARAMQASGIQDEKATRDAVVTTVGVVIFWPALFFIGGNDQQTAELAQLRGQAEAIEQSARHKQCGMGAQARQSDAHAEEPPSRRAQNQDPPDKRHAKLDRDRIIGLPFGLKGYD